MSRKDLLVSIANTIADYRLGEIAKADPAHVERWVRQFSKDAQDAFLQEIDHTLKKTYFSRDGVIRFLSDKVICSKNLAGADFCAFWPTATFLSIQQNGESQQSMLELFDGVLKKTCKVSAKKCGAAGGPFIYLDDVVFTGSRVGSDLERWIAEDAPKSAKVHVITMAVHTLGEWQAGNRLKEAAKKAGKGIEVKFWCSRRIENRKSNKDDSEVLWPTELPPVKAVTDYAAQDQKFPYIPRKPGGKLAESVFSSEKGRALLEQEFLIAGVKIRGYCANPKPIMRPLGFSAFGLGFGSTIATFRNSPNNSPLAIWWGDPTANASHPLSKWYPLLPRKTYKKEIDLNEIFS